MLPVGTSVKLTHLAVADLQGSLIPGPEGKMAPCLLSRSIAWAPSCLWTARSSHMTTTADMPDHGTLEHRWQQVRSAFWQERTQSPGLTDTPSPEAAGDADTPAHGQLLPRVEP